jgi:hypothetical protein
MRFERRTNRFLFRSVFAYTPLSSKKLPLGRGKPAGGSTAPCRLARQEREFYGKDVTQEFKDERFCVRVRVRVRLQASPHTRTPTRTPASLGERAMEGEDGNDDDVKRRQNLFEKMRGIMQLDEMLRRAVIIITFAATSAAFANDAVPVPFRGESSALTEALVLVDYESKSPRRPLPTVFGKRGSNLLWDQRGAIQLTALQEESQFRPFLMSSIEELEKYTVTFTDDANAWTVLGVRLYQNKGMNESMEALARARAAEPVERGSLAGNSWDSAHEFNHA